MLTKESRFNDSSDNATAKGTAATGAFTTLQRSILP